MMCCERRGRDSALVLLLPLFFAYTGLRTSVSLVNSGELWLWCGSIVVTAVATTLMTAPLIDWIHLPSRRTV